MYVYPSKLDRLRHAVRWRLPGLVSVLAWLASLAAVKPPPRRDHGPAFWRRGRK